MVEGDDSLRMKAELGRGILGIIWDATRKEVATK